MGGNKGGHELLGFNEKGMREVRTVCHCGLIEIWEADPEEVNQDFLAQILPECEACARRMAPMN